MTTSKRAAAPEGGTEGAAAREPRLSLRDDGSGGCYALVAVYRYRFLFANGDVLDVLSTCDDSDLRRAVLDMRNLNVDRIVGVSDGEHCGHVSTFRE